MCLRINKEQTEKYNKILNRHGEVKVIKTFRGNFDIEKRTFHLETPFQGKELKLNKNGFFVSDRKTKELAKFEKSSNSVYKGIHCFKSIKDIWYNCQGKNKVHVEVTIKKNDFIAASTDSLVATRIHIDTKDLKKAIKDAALKEMEYLKVLVSDGEEKIKQLKQSCQDKQIELLKTKSMLYELNRIAMS